MRSAFNYINWHYTIDVYKMSVQQPDGQIVKFRDLQKSKQLVFTISGSSMLLTSYSIAFNLNVIADLTASGELIIYNLPIEYCNKVFKCGHLSYIDKQGIKINPEYMSVDITISYRGKTATQTFQVNMVQTTGFPTRQTKFTLSGIVGMSSFAVLKENELTTQEQKPTLGSLWQKVRDTASTAVNMLSAPEYTYQITERLCERYGYVYIKEHNNIMYDYLKVHEPTSSTFIEALKILYPNCAFCTQNTELFIKEKNGMFMGSLDETTLTPEQKQLKQSLNTQYATYISGCPHIVISESTEPFMDIPYYSGDGVISLRLMLNVGITMASVVKLDCHYPATKIFGENVEYKVIGLKYSGKFSTTTRASGSTEVSLAPLNLN